MRDDVTLTRAALADLLRERIGLSGREAKELVDAFFEEILGALERGDIVRLPGFGNFQLRGNGRRPGRKAKSGAAIPTKGRRRVTFRANGMLKTRIAGKIRSP